MTNEESLARLALAKAQERMKTIDEIKLRSKAQREEAQKQAKIVAEQIAVGSAEKPLDIGNPDDQSHLREAISVFLGSGWHRWSKRETVRILTALRAGDSSTAQKIHNDWAADLSEATQSIKRIVGATIACSVFLCDARAHLTRLAKQEHDALSMDSIRQDLRNTTVRFECHYLDNIQLPWYRLRLNTRLWHYFHERLLTGYGTPATTSLSNEYADKLKAFERALESDLIAQAQTMSYVLDPIRDPLYRLKESIEQNEHPEKLSQLVKQTQESAIATFERCEQTIDAYLACRIALDEFEVVGQELYPMQSQGVFSLPPDWTAAWSKYTQLHEASEAYTAGALIDIRQALALRAYLRTRHRTQLH